jgi:outer membrane protein TolC
VDVQQETFNKNLTVTLSRIEADISKFSEALERDKQIIDLRKQVISSAKSKLENGVMTSAEYIADLNQLKKARLTHEQHKIELAKSKLDYLMTSGNLDMSENENN